MFCKNQVIFFFTIFIRYVNLCTDTIYQIETSKEIRSRKRADIINLDKLPLNLVDISVSQWSTAIRRFWCGAPNTATSPCYHMLHVAVTTMFRFSNRLLRDLRTLRPKPGRYPENNVILFLIAGGLNYSDAISPLAMVVVNPLGWILVCFENAFCQSWVISNNLIKSVSVWLLCGE